MAWEQDRSVQARSPVSGKFRWPEGKRAAISLSFDDARLSQVDAGVSLLNRYGVKATFYVSPPRLRDRLEGWKKIAAGGHEIGNHSLNHPCSGNFPFARQRALEEYSIDQMRQELVGANKAIEDMLGVMPKTFAYPCGQKFVGRGREVKSYVPLVAELFLAGRGFMDEAPNDPGFCDLAQVLGVSCDNKDFEQIRPLFEQALESGSWLILAGHEIGQSDARQTTRFSMLEALFLYAQDPSRGIWIDTIHSIAGYILKQRG